MGFTPQQINEMGLWEFQSAVVGYAESHGAKANKTTEIDESRLRDMGIEGF